MMDMMFEKLLEIKNLALIDVLKNQKRIAKEVMDDFNAISRFGVSYYLKVDDLQKAITEHDTATKVISNFLYNLRKEDQDKVSEMWELVCKTETEIIERNK